MLQDSVCESFCYDKRMFIKPSKNQCLLFFISLVLFIFYYATYRVINLINLIETNSIALSILLIFLPLLILSIIPSYVLVRMINIKNPSFIVTAVLFSLFYILVSFISLVIFAVIGGL